MSRIIEAKAVISAEDRTGKAFDAINKRFNDMSKAGKAAKEIGRLGKELDQAARGMKEIQNFRSTQASFGQARSAYRSTQTEVARLARELDKARKASVQFEGVRTFSKNGAMASEMAAARKQVTDLERQFTSAQRAVKAAASAYDAQATALKTARREVEGSGVSVGKLVQEEQRLKAAIDGVNASYVRQAGLQHASASMTAGMGAAGRHEAERIRQNRRLVDGMGAPARAERERVAEEHVRKRATAGGDMISGMGVSGRAEADRIHQSRRLIDGMGMPARAEQAEREHLERERSELREQRKADRRDAVGAIAAGTGLYVSHRGKEIGLEAINAAARMDYAVRYQHVATDVSEEMQKNLLLPQAKRIGQETRFSNEDVVEAQTATMQGLPYKDPDMKAKVGAAIVDQARNYAVLFQSTLTSGSEGLRSFLQNTNKDMSTPEKAEFESRRATNLIVKSAKLGGMNNEDAQQYIKFGVPTATQAGFSDVTTMALGALARRSGLKGDEAGVFVRAASSKLISPTREGREAEIMAGIDRSKYQKMPEQLSEEAFEKIGKGRFGLHLSKSQRGRLGAMFRDGDLLQDEGEFTKRVSGIVSESFEKNKKGKLKAQDANKIAKLASQFYRMSVESTDVEGLLLAHMNSPTFTAALRNKFYTDKHGGKAGILGQKFDQFKDDREQLDHVTKEEPNFAKDRSDYMTKGLGGAIDNLKGSFETVILNLGTANAPMVQKAADGLAAFGDAIANLPQQMIQAGTGIGLLVGTATTAASALTIAGRLLGSTTMTQAGATIARMGFGTVTGAPLIGGTLAGGWLDWNFGGNPGAIGALTGQESDHQKSMRYQRNRAAGNAATDRLGYRPTIKPGFSPSMTLPGDVEGGGARDGYATEFRTSRGLWGDFLWGQQKGSMQLPGFGAGNKAIPVEIVSKRSGGPDSSGQVDALNNTLEKRTAESTTAANGGKPIEATVRPDQLVAKVSELPPVTGEAKVTVDQNTHVTVEVNADWIKATARSEARSAVAAIPLSSSGARPGAISMPGAAANPGAQ